MHVLMRIGMVEGQTGRGVGSELGFNFEREFAPCGGGEEIIYTGGGLAECEFAVWRCDVRQFIMAGAGITVDQDEMQAGIEIWQSLGPRDRIRRFGGGDHQAGLGEHASRVSNFDRVIDGEGETEIIGGENDVWQSFTGCGEQNLKSGLPCGKAARNGGQPPTYTL
jgi:hypothetical protein